MRIKSCPVKGIAGQPPFRERTASAGFKPVPALQAPAPFCQTAKKEACNITPKAALPPGLSQSNKRTADAASQKKGLGQRTPAEPDHEKKVCGLFRFCQRNGAAHCSRLFCAQNMHLQKRLAFGVYIKLFARFSLSDTARRQCQARRPRSRSTRRARGRHGRR